MLQAEGFGKEYKTHLDEGMRRFKTDLIWGLKKIFADLLAWNERDGAKKYEYYKNIIYILFHENKKCYLLLQ